MSTSITPSSTTSRGAAAAPARAEIKLISHSSLFYWWPVWFVAFFMATWTYLENNRLAIVPPHGSVERKLDTLEFTTQFRFENKNNLSEQYIKAAAVSEDNKTKPKVDVFVPRISAEPSLGAVFIVVLVLTMVVTNVPLRGLWSFLVIMSFILIAVLITLFNGWDRILTALNGLHIHINMAGYLFIGISMFIVWALATWVFDRRAYVIFTPGQIKVCEHIGAAVQTYPTMGMSMTKQRDDLFRHYILGFGSGDLILQMPSGEKREIKLPNILGISWRLKPVEDLIRTMSTTN